MKDYTDKETSELVHKAVPEVETKMWWVSKCCFENDGDGYRRKEDRWVIEKWGSLKPTGVDSAHHCAYTLADVIKAIKVLGERDKEIVIPKEGALRDRIDRLLGAYLADDMCMNGPRVSAFIGELFKEV